MKAFVIIAASVGAFSQVPALTNQGMALPVAMPPPVKQAVSVQAVMLPYAINRELFSKHIADNYAVVVVNVGNRSHDAALLMQGIYLDYSKWALSGNVARQGDWSDHSTGTLSGQVSSVEYRIVRGELEDRDPKTIRNWILRSLTFAGQVAGGSTFAFSVASNLPKYVSMASGVGIPGFEKLWPDSLVSKLNRISDFGYRANRVVPRESSDVMIAFFPLERFLTPALKRIFIRQPAVFFNTGLALVEPNARMTPILERVSGKTLQELTSQIPALMACASNQRAADCEASAVLRELVKATSLNSIEVVLDGNMMVDEAAVGPVVERVEIEGQSITVNGRFLDGGRVIAEPEGEWVADMARSTAERLVGTLRFSKPLVGGQQLRVAVMKGGKSSAAVAYTVKTAAALSVTGRVALVTGTVLSLARVKPDAAPAVLFPIVPIVPIKGQNAIVDLRTLPAGCYDATVFTADGMPLTRPVRLAPQPAITKAVRTGNAVVVEGSDLFALTDSCAVSPLGVAVLDEKGGLFTPGNVVLKSGALTFDFAFPEDPAKWRVQVTGSSSAPIK